jgi:hypothetical protein
VYDHNYLNKNMVALPIGYYTSGVDLVCATPLAATPRGFVRVYVGGLAIETAENMYEGRAFWSYDETPPFAPIALADLTEGAYLIWCTNNLGVLDVVVGGETVDFDYEVAPTANALVTTTDGDLATNDEVSTLPVRRVTLNDLPVALSNGDKSKDCYFSGDSGVTARAIVDIDVGDQLYWMGSQAGYELLDTDVIAFV